MRRIRMALGLALLFAFSVAAVPAVAHNFTASRLPKPISEAEPAKTRGISIESELATGERPEKFKFGNFEILCAAATHATTEAEGAITWATNQTLSTEVKFTKCLTKAHFGSFVAGLKTSFNVNPETKKAEPIKFVYHVNGFAEIGTGETVSEVEVGSGAANFSISGKVCKISWPAQVVPAAAVKKPEGEYSSAVYSTAFVPVGENLKTRFPTLEQERLDIVNNFKAMEWSMESGQCVGEGGFEEGTKGGGKTAKFEGAFEIQAANANLGFE